MFSDIIPYLSPLAILASASIGATMAAVSIMQSRKTARTKATLDLVLNHQESEYRETLANEFRQYRDDESGLKSILENNHSAIIASKSKIFEFLNYYEVISVGFDHGILDQQFYYQFWKSPFIRDWNSSKDFIKLLQKTNPKIFENFEKYALAWEKDELYSPIKGKKKHRIYLLSGTISILIIAILIAA
jgi:hypothetical protein